MRWQLTEEQTMFAEALRGWLGQVAPASALRRWRDSGDTDEFDRALGGEWLGVGTPESLGGQGGGLVELALAAEEFGRGAAPSSVWSATVLAAPAFAGRDDTLAQIVGRGTGAALVVPADRPADVPPAVRRDGTGLHGAVRGVLAADRVAELVVPVAGGDGIELVEVDPHADGVTVTPRRLIDTSHTVADVEFDGATPAGTLDVAAADVLRRAALRGAVLVAADAVGAMDRMVAMAVEYSGQRRQFGVPVGSFQAVKHAAAQMLVDVEAGRSIVYLAAASVDADDPEAPLHAAAAKAQVGAAATRVADAALTVHGAIGYTWEYDLQLFYKRARFDRHRGGAPQEWNERLAAALPLVPGQGSTGRS